MMSLRNGLLTWTLALAVSAGAAQGCSKGDEGAAALPPASGEGASAMPALPVLAKNTAAPTAQPGPGRTTGTTYAKEEAKVGPKLSGVITKIWVDEGTRVKKGDLLFKLDTSAIQLGRQQAAAALKSAEVNLRAIQVEYDRTKMLLDQNAANRAQMDQMQARLDAAKVMVEQARVALSQAGQTMADATRRSPIDGVVVAKLANEGEMATMMPPTVVVVVQDQSTLELRFRMPEKALATITKGSRIKATFDAVGVTREAAVVRVSPAVEAHTRTVEIVAEIPNADGALKSGMLADVEMLDGAGEPAGGEGGAGEGKGKSKPAGGAP